MDSFHYCYHHPSHPQEKEAFSDMELMFEKQLTPSDVGKLNRLVIPKQHAEKFFPPDVNAGEKGLLLSFEDDSSQTWQFRYSYWTSSQRYVLTKGWSRFVREKQLDAGDIVVFLRRRPPADDRLYIGCRRRGYAAEQSNVAAGATAENSKWLRLFGIQMKKPACRSRIS